MTGEAFAGADIPAAHRPVRRRIVAGATVVVILGGAAFAGARTNWYGLAKSGTSQPNGTVADNTAPIQYGTVTQRDLSAQTQVNGTLGYAGSYSVINRAMGTYTWLPAVGQVINQGQALYQVNGAPTWLLYGPTPVYRDLAENATGADVTELNAALVSLGYATRSQIDPTSDDFNWETKAAVERMQAAMGVTQDGVLHQGQAVFLPGAVRITTVNGTLGGQAGPGPMATATAVTRQVTVALDATQQAQVKVGDQVIITLPNNQTTPGVVASVGTVATSSSSGSGSNNNTPPTVQVDITPTDPAATGSLDQAPVQVSITTATASNALVVPVNALLALANSGYAVEVVEPGGAHRLVAVTLGLFDDADGLVQVTNTALRPGERVVVAGT